MKGSFSRTLFTPATGILLFLLSAATLTYEINLTRLFSVAQFYHFAFMIVSIALLGFGASGTILAGYPGLGQKRLHHNLGWLALASGTAMLAAYLLINWVPFDSFSIAWDRRQAFILTLHYLALATPFFFSGMAVSLLLTAHPQVAGTVYSINLLGSALGCLIAMVAPSLLGGEGVVSLSSALCILAALILILSREYPQPRLLKYNIRLLIAVFLFFFTLLDLTPRSIGKSGLPIMGLRLSPYKALSYALQYPRAEIIYQRWNAYSRVDVVRSQGIRSLPGLSYRYLQPPPLQDGLLVDGNDLTPIVRDIENSSFVGYLPSALAFQLKPQAETLILEARGGLDILVALASGARHVTAIEVNPLIVEAATPIYRNPNVTPVILSDRAYLRQTEKRYDVVLFSLVNSYHPIRSGAYSLVEDYRYTIEAFQDALFHLNPDGILVITRWHQLPPTEGLRVFITIVTALKRIGTNPKEQVAVLRGYNTVTFFVKNNPFSSAELALIRKFAADRAFDLDYLPDLRPEEVNRFNVLPEPLDHQAYLDVLSTQSLEAYSTQYLFDVSPPTDNRPFFSHFFKWSQAREVIAELGKTWQPFGGAGYFVVIALLILATFAAGILIILPTALLRGHSLMITKPTTSLPSQKRFGILAYFGFLGLGFLLVEIPLIQRFILYLDNPAYAMTGVLFALLFFSGIGSRLSYRFSMGWALGLLILLLSTTPIYLPWALSHTLGFPLVIRLILTILFLAPTGFLMGIPFPAGIRPLSNQPESTTLIPWAWAVNGSLSVVSAVLAALLSLSWGFAWVFRIGALCYAGAWLMVVGKAFPIFAPRQVR